MILNVLHILTQSYSNVVRHRAVLQSDFRDHAPTILLPKEYYIIRSGCN